MDSPYEIVSSKVNSSEKKDRVPSLIINRFRSQSKIKKYKSEVVGKGSFLRVRTNSIGGPRNSVVDNSAVIDNPNEKFDYFYKILVIGDVRVGKTNFLLRCTRGEFNPFPKAT